jgi:hypothetical protein
MPISAPPARRPATRHATPAKELGHRALIAAPAQPLPTPRRLGAAGHAGHDPALAPTAGRPPPDDRTYPTQSISHSPDARRSALPRAPGTRLRGTIGAATVLEEEIWLRAR